MMDKQDKYNEPWEFDIYYNLCDSEGNPIADTDMGDSPYLNHAERIKACVNACAGIPTEDLAYYMQFAKAQCNIDEAMEANAMTRTEFNAMIAKGEIEEGKVYMVKEDA